MSNKQEVLKVFEELKHKYQNKIWDVDKTGCKIVEVLGAKLILDPTDPYIDLGFRKTNHKYAKKELEWYDSQSLNIEEIGKIASVWKNCADKDGNINSNYGYLIYSDENGNQYTNCVNELKSNPNSRRAIMIYNRPNMHTDAFENGRNDFVCTLAHQFFIRNKKLESIVNMRSNDFIFGFLNDFVWFATVHNRVCQELVKSYPELKVGNLIHIANSMHIYERHFGLFDE